MLGRLRREDGSTVVIAVVMVSLMLVVGGAALATVDTQSDVVKRDRQHESTFNLVEGVLNAQTFVLGRLGTGNAGNQFPINCTSAAPATLCPSPEQIARTYSPGVQNDYAGTVSWWTQVRDNPNGNFYSPTAVAAAPRYDANGDDRLWVTAAATVRGRTRTLVALIAVENLPITFPNYAMVGAYLETSNSGNSEIINATGSLGIAVRCGLPPQSASCLDYSTKKGGQLTPPGAYQLNYAAQIAIQPDALAALEDFAKMSGTYYATCPSTPPNGAVIVIASGNCPKWQGNESSCCNSASQPGLLIMKCGSVEFGGSVVFHGLVYVPNRTTTEVTGNWCSDDVVVTTSGNSRIVGGVLVDGPGGIKAGSSGGATGPDGKKGNITYSPAAFNGVAVAGTAGVVQNTWREIPDDN